MEISIVANGEVKNGQWLRENIRGTVIAADGGANLCKEHGVIPQFIVGDLDSVHRETLDFFKDSEVVRLEDQNKTDLEKALAYAKEMGAGTIYVFGALGGSVDHTMANILSLSPQSIIRDESHDVHVVENELQITGDREDVVSVIALSSVSGLSYEGLKWSAPEMVNAGWIGARNRLKSTSATIRLKKGRIAVIKSSS